jgi:hypothetical protein
MLIQGIGDFVIVCYGVTACHQQREGVEQKNEIDMIFHVSHYL